ncbi:MAG: LuxR C-terminal-related transcriptional regulator [Bdellovibrionota bacterium]
MKSPAKSSTSNTSKALGREVRAFCERHQLTPRESEILALLVEGVVRIKEVALKLKLSPNTVNNHVNSIFMKTRTRSKSQVLAELLSSVAEELQIARSRRYSPRVLVCERDPSAGIAMAKELQTRGFRCLAIPALDRLESALAELGPSFVLVDSTALQSPPRELLDRVQAMSPAHTIFVGPGPRVGSVREAMDAGAIDWVPRPFDAANLANVLLVHSIEDDSERSRWLEREAHDFKALPQPLSCSPDNVGRGGILVSAKDVATAIGIVPSPGDWLEFKMTLDKVAEPVSARGQVVWTHQQDGRAGVRFTYLPATARETLTTFVRQHAVRSYIPCGMRSN